MHKVSLRFKRNTKLYGATFRPNTSLAKSPSNSSPVSTTLRDYFQNEAENIYLEPVAEASARVGTSLILNTDFPNRQRRSMNAKHKNLENVTISDAFNLRKKSLP